MGLSGTILGVTLATWMLHGLGVRTICVPPLIRQGDESDPSGGRDGGSVYITESMVTKLSPFCGYNMT